MAVVAFTSTQKSPTTPNRLYPIDAHGKTRMVFFNFTAAVAGDANSTIDLADLPLGRVRLLLARWRLQWSAFGAARVLSVGHAAYIKADDRTSEPENLTAFLSGIDVSAASATGGVAPTATAFKYDLFSQKGVTLKAQVTGGTIPVGAVLTGYAEYIYE